MKVFFVFIILVFLINPCLGIMLNRVIAVVNGEVITGVDLVNYARRSAIKDDISSLSPEEEDRLLKESLNSLIEDMLILSFAKKNNLSVDAFEIEKRISAVKSNFATEIEFLNALEKDGLSYQGLYKKIHDDMLKKITVNYFVNRKIEIHPDEVRSYFDDHLKDFPRPERTKVQKIHISKDDSLAAKKINQIEKLLRKNVSFEDLAQNHSISDDTLLNGGEWVERGSLNEVIDSAVFSLNIGQVSDVIETENSFYIFKILDKEPQSMKAFDEVKDDIYGLIYKDKFENNFNKFIEDLKKDAEIEVKI